MLSAESSLVQAARMPADRILAQFAVSGRSRSHTRAIAAIGKRSLKIHVLMVTALVLLWMVISSSSVVLILGGCVFLVGCISIARNEAQSTPVLINPLSWMFTFQAFYLGLGSIWIGSRLGGLNWMDFGGQKVSIDNIVEGFICYAIGSLAMHFGLQRSRPKVSIAASHRNASPGSLSVIIALWVCGIFLAFFGNYFHALGSFKDPLQWGNLSAACSIAIAPPRPIRARSPIHWCAILIATGGCLVAEAIVGLKFFIMLSALPLVWLFMLHRYLRKSLLVLIPALALIYLYMVGPIIGGLRQINQGANIRASLIENVKEGHLEEIIQIEQTSLVEKLDGLMVRGFYSLYVGYLVQDAKATGFKMGATMDYVRYAFIPRIFWPDKPNVSRGAWFTVYLHGARNEDSATTASALTAEGELYWNFGLAGMIAGMAALGWLIGRLVWQTVGIDPRTNPIRMLALLVTISLVSGETEAGTLLVTIIPYAVVLHLMLKSYEMFGKPR